jgi:hypothetical protein
LDAFLLFFVFNEPAPFELFGVDFDDWDCIASAKDIPDALLVAVAYEIVI